jgi:hypothetical protein
VITYLSKAVGKDVEWLLFLSRAEGTLLQYQVKTESQSYRQIVVLHINRDMRTVPLHRYLNNCMLLNKK